MKYPFVFRYFHIHDPRRVCQVPFTYVASIWSVLALGCIVRYCCLYNQEITQRPSKLYLVALFSLLAAAILLDFLLDSLYLGNVTIVFFVSTASLPIFGLTYAGLRKELLAFFWGNEDEDDVDSRSVVSSGSEEITAQTFPPSVLG